MTQNQIILHELQRGVGTCRQLADRTGLSLNNIRVLVSSLKSRGKIRKSGIMYKLENVWELIE